MVEALACQRAVQFAVEIGLYEVVFEGDTVVIINAIAQGSANQSLYGHIVDDILTQAFFFIFLCFLFCSSVM